MCLPEASLRSQCSGGIVIDCWGDFCGILVIGMKGSHHSQSPILARGLENL